MSVFADLLDEAALLAPDADAAAVLTRFADQRASGVRVGRLVVPDTALAATARLTTGESLLPVSVVVSGGAGAVVALADRSRTGLRLAAVEADLRDLDDLAGNAARVAAAAEALPDDVVVHVGLPSAVAPTEPGWLRAVGAVEMAGLLARVDARGPATMLAERLSTLVEADLGFKLSGIPAGQLTAVVTLVDALVDGVGPDEAARMLAEPVPAAAVLGWDEVRTARVRRRLVAVDCVDPGSWLAVALGGRD